MLNKLLRLGFCRKDNFIKIKGSVLGINTHVVTTVSVFECRWFALKTTGRRVEYKGMFSKN